MDSRTPFALAFFAAIVASACASQGTTSPFQPGTGDDAGTGGDDTTGDDSGTGDDDGGSVTSDSGTDAGPTNVKLPFYVSDQFFPSGFMGDSDASRQALTVTHDATSCKTPRQSGVGGDCYAITWNPTVADGGAAWSGVYWQYPEKNWGTKQGKAIPAGATKVSFYAAGAAGGETIQSCAGGINTGTVSTASPYADTFSVKSPNIVLTTTWTKYELSLQGASYTNVLGAFCWSTAYAGKPMKFYIDDIQWQ